jgi:TPR repeat protein
MAWYERCAAAGGSFCMRFYGLRYLAGEVVERDLRKGLEWVTRAAEAGNYWAIDDLSKIYGYGQYGIPRDRAQAAPWMRKAAAAGSAEARGWLLANGLQVE